MTITKEVFVDLEEKYQKVFKLIKEDSKLDPENEPYLSKYAARQILIGMKANLERLIPQQQTDSIEHRKLSAMLGVVHLYLGTIGIDTDELSEAEKHLEKCRDITQNWEDRPEFILLSLNLYNQFGLLWAQREPQKSKGYLEKAIELYHKFLENNVPPFDLSQLFTTNNENIEEFTTQAWKNFENNHTLTFYYLAQIYGFLNDPLKSAVYCHITLQKQLDMDFYEPIDWALNAATLSQFFMEKCGYKQARHHLAASSYVLDKYKVELDSITERDEVFESKLERFQHRSADVARCWSKYGLCLLSKSKERLLAHTEDIDEKCEMISDLRQLKLEDNCTVSHEQLQNLNFTGIDVSNYENQITDQFILTLADAKKVFPNVQNWLSKAQEYYNLDNHASDFIETVIDQSHLYFYVLFFDESLDNQAKLHKRRIDILEDVISKVNSQYYLQYCRQVWFELGQCYSDILDIKSEKLRETKERPKPQALSKINHFVDKSITHYSNFINSFKEISSGKLPQKIQSVTEKTFLQAYFHFAALHGRYITLDKTVQVKHVEEQYEHYKFIVEYCDKHQEAKSHIPMEYGICKEMVTLLPVKILRLKN